MVYIDVLVSSNKNAFLTVLAMAADRSKKGFKKLQALEMVEVNENGKFLENSDSETDLLGLTDTVKGGRLRKSPTSCWHWCGVLYVGLLTLVVILMGVFSGYVLTTIWQVSSSENTSHNSLQQDIQNLKREIKVRDDHTFYILDAIRETMFTMNQSIVNFNAMTLTSLQAVGGRLTEVEMKIGAMEEEPQTALIRAVEGIHKEMAVLGMDMRSLNNSLEELQLMRKQMASFGSMLDSYDSHLKTLSRTIGDTVHDNTDIQDSIQGFGDRISQFGDRIEAVEKQESAEHNKIQQSSDLLSAQLFHLQSMMADQNATLLEEVGEIWVNMTATRAALDYLRGEVMSMATSSAEKQLSSDEPAPPTSLPQTSTSSTPQLSTFPLHITTSTPSTPHSPIILTEDDKRPTMPDVQNNSLSETTSSQTHSSITVTKQPSRGTEDASITQGVANHSDIDTTEGSTVSSSLATASDDDSGGTQGVGQDPVTDAGPQTNVSSPVISEGTPATTDNIDDDVNTKNNSAIDLLERMMRSFNFLDMSGDNDNALDYNEFSVLFHSKHIFDNLDLNHNHHLEYAELQKILRKLQLASSKDKDGTATPSLETPVQGATGEGK